WFNKQKIVHHDLHSGKILQDTIDSYIADLGSSIPTDKTSSSENNVYGVLSYVAPEVLRGQSYSMASDIYSFGVLMSMVSIGKQPFNLAHDAALAVRICEGVRPGFSNNTPKIYIELAYKCMDADPYKRPTAKEVHETIKYWH